MKKIISVIIIICMLLNGVNALALVDFKYDRGVLTFSGEGQVSGHFYGKLSFEEEGIYWWEEAVEAEKIVFEDGITSTGMSFNFHNAKEVVLGSTFKSLEVFAFDAPCLEKITVDKDNPYFTSVDGVLYSKDMTNLVWYPDEKKGESFILPENVIKIGDYAFDGNAELKRVVINNACEEIGLYAFQNSGIEKIELKNVKYIKNEAFSGCERLGEIVFGEALEEIGEKAFSKTGIKSVVIPKGVKIVGNSAFSYCKSLESVKLENGVGTIGAQAFANSLLSWVDLPDEYVEIGTSAFYGSEALRDEGGDLYVDDYLIKAKGTGEYNVKEGTRFISSGAFSGMKDITAISFPESVKGIGNIFTNYGTWNGGNIERLKIGKGVEYIAPGALEKCGDLLKIEVDDENPYFADIDNNLYTKDMKKLIKCANEGKESYNVPEGVEEIENGAFYGVDIQKVKIPDSVINIGMAFNGSAIGEITLGNGLERLEDKAFYECRELEKINFGDNIKEIGEVAFAYCSKLEEVIIPDSVNVLGDDVFLYSGVKRVDIGRQVTDAGKNTFQYCKELVEVTGGESLTQIKDGMFNGAGKLKHFTIGDKVTEIGKEAFYYCTSLEKVVLGENVKTVKNNAFDSCESLKEIVINAKLENAGDFAFHDLHNIEKFSVDENNAYFKSIDGSLYTKDGKTLLVYASKGKEFVIPEGVERIKSYAVSKRDDVEKIIVSDSVRVIDQYAITNNKNLKEIKLGSGVETITGYAMINNVAMESITIKGAKNVGEYAVYGSTGLKTAIFEEGVETIGEYVFYKCENLEEIYLPKSIKSIMRQNVSLPKLNCVYYASNEEDWEKIEFSPYENVINKARRVYNYTDIGVEYDGIKVDFAPYGQYPVIENGRTLVPLRSVFETLGASVHWEDSTKSVTAEKGDVKIKLTTGDKVMVIDEEKKELDTPPVIKNNRTLVPVRAVAEAFGCSVQWDNETRTVIIKSE